MEQGETVKADGEGAEEEYDLRLKALLHDLVSRNGRIRAAEQLGLDPRTVGACMDGEGMSWRVREALERVLREGEGSAAPHQRARSDALERRLEALEKELREGLEAMSGEIGELREEQDRRWGSMEQWLVGRESQQQNQQESPSPADAQGDVERQHEEAPATGKPSARAAPLRRLYPELVTKEPAPDDKEVFGKAWPLIEEWREIWKAGHTGAGRGLAWLETEERVRELEVAMLEKHGLTLPPEKQPLHGLYRSDQLDWRKETLNEVRRAVAWRHLLWKVVTCGLWRSRWWRAGA